MPKSMLDCNTTFPYYNVWHAPGMPGLECSADDKARLIAIGKSRTGESHEIEGRRLVRHARGDCAARQGAEVGDGILAGMPPSRTRVKEAFAGQIVCKAKLNDFTHYLEYPAGIRPTGGGMERRRYS